MEPAYICQCFLGEKNSYPSISSIQNGKWSSICIYSSFSTNAMTQMLILKISGKSPLMCHHLRETKQVNVLGSEFPNQFSESMKKINGGISQSFRANIFFLCFWNSSWHDKICCNLTTLLFPLSSEKSLGWKFSNCISYDDYKASH